MKRIVLAAAVALITGPSYAAIQVHEYVYAVIGPNDCKIPKDAANPKPNECVIERLTYQTGTEIVKKGTSCIQVERTLDRMQKMKMQNGWTVEEPQMHTTMTAVPCPAKEPN